MKIVTAEIMKRLDRRTIEDFGIPGMVLMENAARSVVNALRRNFPDLPKRRVALFAGRGNNGGDALAVARYLHNKKIFYRVYLLAEKSELRDEAAANLEILTKMGGEIVTIVNSEDLANLKMQIAHHDLFIDGIFGTGLKGPIKGLAFDVIDFLNSLQRPIVAIDLPSGVDADTGQIWGICVKATLTVTFGLPKRGLFIYPGAQYCGHLLIADISIPEAAINQETIKEYIMEAAEFARLLPPRQPNTHKGDFGHLFVLAGSPGKTGAAAMVCEAAVRVGAGLVTLGIPESLNPILEVKLTEAMTEPLPETKEKALSLSALNRIRELMYRKTALALGPGLSLNPQTTRLVQKILRENVLPVVVDADGLSAITGKTDILKRSRAPIILTPHPGEMARLLGMSIPEIQQNRIEVARRFAEENKVILILKGARSLIASPEGEVFVNPTGNPGMASGGMGDVLTGMIGGFLAQGLPALEAAKLGVFLHGLVGDFVAYKKGERGLAATDLIWETPKILKALAMQKTQIDDFSFPMGLEVIY